MIRLNAIRMRKSASKNQQSVRKDALYWLIERGTFGFSKPCDSQYPPPKEKGADVYVASREINPKQEYSRLIS